jgi:uncharacterized protein with HEPN domain
MRNRLMHGYDWVDFDILWQTVIEDIPELVAMLEAIVQAEDRAQARQRTENP